MELDKLRVLLTLLREHGVAEFSDDKVSIKLAALVEVEADEAPDLSREGFDGPVTDAEHALREVLRKVDARYADPSLFEIG